MCRINCGILTTCAYTRVVHRAEPCHVRVVRIALDGRLPGWLSFQANLKMKFDEGRGPGAFAARPSSRAEEERPAGNGTSGSLAFVQKGGNDGTCGARSCTEGWSGR